MVSEEADHERCAVWVVVYLFTRDTISRTCEIYCGVTHWARAGVAAMEDTDRLSTISHGWHDRMETSNREGRGLFDDEPTLCCVKTSES